MSFSTTGWELKPQGKFGWLIVCLLTFCYISLHLNILTSCSSAACRRNKWVHFALVLLLLTVHRPIQGLITVVITLTSHLLFFCTLMTEWIDCGSLQWLYFPFCPHQLSQWLTFVFSAFIKVYSPTTVTVCCINQTCKTLWIRAGSNIIYKLLTLTSEK